MSTVIRSAGLLLTFSALAWPIAAGAQDVQAGRSAFVICAGCHSIDGTKLPTGPTLKGVAGRQAASVPGHAYSAALKASGIRWTPATLDAYLAAPTTLVPGTTHLLNVSDAAQRRQLIAYLQTLK